MKLYYFPLSGYSRKVLITLYEKDIMFEREIVNLFDEEQRRNYLEINPFGKVPHLIRDDGWQIPESSIIMEYLDQSFDQGPRLIPDDKELARQARFYDRVGDLYLIEPTGALFFEQRKPEDQQNAELIEKSKTKIVTSLKGFNHHLEERVFALGESFSMADISASCALYYTQTMIDMTDFPNVVRWGKDVHSRPSWQRVISESEPFMAEFMGD